MRTNKEIEKAYFPGNGIKWSLFDIFKYFSIRAFLKCSPLIRLSLFLNSPCIYSLLKWFFTDFYSFHQLLLTLQYLLWLAIFSCLNKINKQDSIEIIFMVLIILILPAPLWCGKTEEDSPISKTFLGTKKDFGTFLPDNFI